MRLTRARRWIFVFLFRRGVPGPGCGTALPALADRLHKRLTLWAIGPLAHHARTRREVMGTHFFHRRVKPKGRGFASGRSIAAEGFMEAQSAPT